MQDQKPSQQPQQRPQLLTVICILSFIGSGMAGLSYFMIWASYHEMMPLLEEATRQFPAFEMFLNTGRNFFLTGFVLYFISLYGVSLMWRMRKAGFHFYTGAQIVILLMPLFYIDNFPVPFLDGALTLAFVFLYYRFYPTFTS